MSGVLDPSPSEEWHDSLFFVVAVLLVGFAAAYFSLRGAVGRAKNGVSDRR